MVEFQMPFRLSVYPRLAPRSPADGQCSVRKGPSGQGAGPARSASGFTEPRAAPREGFAPPNVSQRAGSAGDGRRSINRHAGGRIMHGGAAAAEQ